MNVPENEDVQLTEQNFRNVCRLCLRADEDLINVFERADQNPLKQPLTERIYDLYQIKVRMKFYFILELVFCKKKINFLILAGQRRWITHEHLLSLSV